MSLIMACRLIFIWVPRAPAGSCSGGVESVSGGSLSIYMRLHMIMGRLEPIVGT